MKKINFGTDVLPHALAIIIFLVVTAAFFNPVFFGNRAISQGDITQFLWGSKELRDFRDATGEEGLWANAMFSGMPAYMINLDWSDGAVTGIKKVMSLFLPHPINNIFLAFLCYYIMLLAFGVRTSIAIAGAVAFGLCSYMIIGLSAGHNARIGSIAFMPLVMAGIHLTFLDRKVLGAGVTALGMAMHLRENHMQVTYYLMMIVGVYGLIRLIEAVREKRLPELAKTLGVLIGAVVIAACTFFGPLWAIQELTRYSTRGQSELKAASSETSGSGLPRSYAFEYSNGILEPLTLLVPNFYGGSSSEVLVNNPDSETYKALVQSGDQQQANRLAQYSSSYWGPQRIAAPYYAGAIMIFLFALGCLVVERKYVWWLVPVSIFAIMMSWGSSFPSFNYFLFDYLPQYNKFRSVTFCLIIVFFSIPLLGAMGLEKLLSEGLTKPLKRKLLVAFGLTGGLCLFLLLFAGIFSFTKSEESELPQWFLQALQADRQSLLRSDAVRSLAFIFSIFILLYLDVPRRISSIGFFVFLGAMVAFDTGLISSRYFSKENYQRKRDNSQFEAAPVDQAILQDKNNFRVLNLLGFYEAHTSNFHHSIGGYSGVRLKRYQELVDSCINRESQQLMSDAQQGSLDLSKFGVLNMLNTKYLTFGGEARQVMRNDYANGNAWFVSEILPVSSPNEELETLKTINTKTTAVIDQTKFKAATTGGDSTATIRLVDQKPYWLKYESQSAAGGLAVFSEIYYPKGWRATIDGQEVPILRVNYVLRALEVPAGAHVIEFVFQPKPYVIGNKVTMASSWILLMVVLASLGWSLKNKSS